MKKRKKNEEPTPAGYTEEGEMEVMAMILDSIVEVSSVRINLPNDLTRADHKLMVKETLKEVMEKLYFSANFMNRLLLLIKEIYL